MECQSLNMYFNEVSKYPVLTPSEERELLKNWNTDREGCKSKLVKHNLRFAIACARKMVISGVSIEDRISAAHVGMMDAVEKFDPSMDWRFITYAVWWMRRRISDLNFTEKLLTIPFGVSRLMAAICSESSSRNVPVSQVRPEDVGETPEHFALAVNMLAVKIEFGRRVGDDVEESYINIPDDGPAPDENVFTREAGRVVSKVLKKSLTEREFDVVSSLFCFGDSQPTTLEEVGKRHGITKERVRQIREQALRKLRRNPALRQLAEEAA